MTNEQLELLKAQTKAMQDLSHTLELFADQYARSNDMAEKRLALETAQRQDLAKNAKAHDDAMRELHRRSAEGRDVYEQKHLELLAALNRSQEAHAVATLAGAMTTRYGVMLEDADTGRCMTFEETAVHYVRIARKALGLEVGP